MISAATIAALEERKLDYILGARERRSAIIRRLVLDDEQPLTPLLVERAQGETQLFVKEVKLGTARYILPQRGRNGTRSPRTAGHRRRVPNGRLLCCGQHVIAFGLHGLDVLEEPFEPVDLPHDLPLQMQRQRTPITGPQLFELGTPIAAQRRITGYPLSEQQPLDPVHDADALGGQCLELARSLTAIFLLRSAPAALHRPAARHDDRPSGLALVLQPGFSVDLGMRRCRG